MTWLASTKVHTKRQKEKQGNKYEMVLKKKIVQKSIST